MSREWCIPLVLKGEATRDDAGLVALALEMAPSLDFERDEDTFLVYVDEPHDVKRAEKAVLHALHKSDVTHAVRLPLHPRRWDELEYRYVDPTGEAEPPDWEVVTPPDQIGWTVCVVPRDAFSWREVRDTLAQRGRLPVGETQRAIEVAARDEADAYALADELLMLPVIVEAVPRRLSWFRRWLLREHFLGNYGDGVWSP